MVDSQNEVEINSDSVSSQIGIISFTETSLENDVDYTDRCEYFKSNDVEDTDVMIVSHCYGYENINLQSFPGENIVIELLPVDRIVHEEIGHEFNLKSRSLLPDCNGFYNVGNEIYYEIFGNRPLRYECFESEIGSQMVHVTEVPSKLTCNDIGIQVNVGSTKYDFSQNFECCSTNLFESEFVSSKCSVTEFEGSGLSFPEENDLEWAEVGLGLNILPITVCTQTDDTFEDFLKIKYTTNISSEISMIIKNYLENRQESISYELDTDLLILDYVINRFGLDFILNKYRLSKCFIDESQNTDDILMKTVWTQTNSKDFDNFFCFPDSSSSMIQNQSNSQQYNCLTSVPNNLMSLGPENKIEKNISFSQIGTNNNQFESIGIERNLSNTKDIKSKFLLHDIYFENDMSKEWSIRKNSLYRKDYEENLVTQFRTQRLSINTSCDEQMSCETNNKMIISLNHNNVQEDEEWMKEFQLIKEIDVEEYEHFKNIEFFKRNCKNNVNEIQFDEKLYISNGTQTSCIDLSESYWKETISVFHNIFSCSSENDMVTNVLTKSNNFPMFQSSESQTEPVCFKGSSLDSEVNEWIDIMEIQEIIHRNKSEGKERTTKCFHNETVDHHIIQTNTMDNTFEFFSTLTESSQTESHINQSKCVSDQDIVSPFQYIMRTEEKKSGLSEIIDLSMSLDVTLISVSNPRIGTKIKNINLAINRGWINIEKGLYCNPSYEEKIPFEVALKLKKIEITELDCPRNRMYGLYIEKTITKLERLLIKDFLNTQTGDIYEGSLAREQGLFLENGSFFDKQLQQEIPFEIALLHHHIEVHKKSEIINYLENDKKYFKIKKVIDTEKNESFDFHTASLKGLVNLSKCSFTDTKNKCDVLFKEAILRGIIEIEKIESITDLYFIHKNPENVIERERSFIH